MPIVNLHLAAITPHPLGKDAVLGPGNIETDLDGGKALMAEPFLDAKA